MSQLPIQGVMPELISGVRNNSQLILKAAPGAGKSTHFPLQLIKHNVVKGKIIMLEPRRLAARNIARYLAEQLGEQVGQRVGYRVRGENKTSQQTQLEVVTEGILTRMIQSDPELRGVDLVIFDEFHERSIHADTALAFCLEIQEALRDDLKLVVMSATLDQLALSRLLPDAEYVESQGRSFPVEHRYVPAKPNERLEDQMAKQITSLIDNESGSLLAFLPGVAAIKRVEERLQHLASDVQICPLYGQLDFAQQQAAIQPAKNGERKVVLATNIAETSLTIEGIRLVVDSGYERVAKFDLKSGVTRLEQTRIAQSSAEQRSGRAGRLEPGICVRLYSEGQLNQQPYVPSPEILHSDLSNLVLELAQWGAQTPEDLSWLDVPPESAINQARALLVQLGLLDSKGQLTEAGNLAAKLGLEPRACAMLAKANDSSQTAAAIIALLEEPERNTLDFMHSVHRLKLSKHSKQKMVIERARTIAKRIGSDFSLTGIDESSVACLLALAFPDRIAQARSNQLGRFLLANGHGAQLEDSQRLAACDYIVVIDLMRGQSESSQIFSALELDLASLQQRSPELYTSIELVDWDEQKGRLIAECQTKLGRLIIERKALPEPPREKMTQALLNFVQRKGLSVLNWTPQSVELLERMRCGQEWLPEQEWPQLDEAGLLNHLSDWLEPYLNGVGSVKALAKVDLSAALLAYLGWPLNQEIDKWLPTHYQVPTGSNKKIRYQLGQDPVLSVRMQEVFGEQASPEIAQGRKRLVLELLSPAQRPLQVTRDLASFWRGAYKEVQKEMKGRYPKHVWPDDPTNHVATTKTKRQLNS
ncbi:ATP-dependent helicase HrpB [Vibrio europaeus]|uniref:ATP-dependent helicase HrpB n=1 Tax=Vibrio europaeus TaxID=300876 RepID=UPI00233E9A49|nr:ATP-dependent helicase HrpB [Vibrio europaeus]MDC5804103.1 ATP-dependent helicase HrpB [Vibrio europaeus]MDC5824844.1 ATP-dependent helicase HrpB [Vibrio europaeus]MDC5829265.1 ATP-dependent helicase HrpB [Vibrio europaeus]MDC5835783.1 ATP-dependent helicase HrpB [Vibrio europaeus]